MKPEILTTEKTEFKEKIDPSLNPVPAVPSAPSVVKTPTAARNRGRPKKRFTFEGRVLFMAIMAGLPGSFISLALIWTGGYTAKVQWTATVFILCFWFGFAFAVKERIVLTLQTLSNLLAALREGDYSIRGRGAAASDALGEVMIEVNALGGTLKERRLGAMEATALLRKVMAEIDVAVFAFDGERKLRLVNKAGETLLGRASERLLGSSAEEIGLSDCLEGESFQTQQLNFPGGTGRWGIRRSVFRERGLPHQLLVLLDLSRTLREEERTAWQRLVRVLGHELNNSLAPIKSIAGSLENLISKDPLPPDWQDDTQRGLAVISSRAEALSRFMSAYARLARLPLPVLAPLEVGPWIRRVAALETRVSVTLFSGPDLKIQADGDQLEQLLINLLRNAADASLETGGSVKIGWEKNGTYFEVRIEDEGHGLSNTANLFVPFFTTKPGGSGIGLVLCRQIAEGHSGSLTLENKKKGRGCEARLRLPI